MFRSYFEGVHKSFAGQIDSSVFVAMYISPQSLLGDSGRAPHRLNGVSPDAGIRSARAPRRGRHLVNVPCSHYGKGKWFR